MLISCCSVVPTDDSTEISNIIHKKTDSPTVPELTFEESTYSLTMIEDGGVISPLNKEARFYFGYPLDFNITLRHLDKHYWWKKYYIFSSSSMDVTTRLRRLQTLTHYYDHLRSELLTQIDNLPSPPQYTPPTNS